MTQTIAETRVRARMQEYDGVSYVYIERRTATEWEWKRVATFSGTSLYGPNGAMEWARECGWEWLLSAEECAEDYMPSDGPQPDVDDSEYAETVARQQARQVSK